MGNRARRRKQISGFVGLEQLEPRAVLSGDGLLATLPLPTDGPLVVTPPTAAAATGFRLMLPPAAPNGMPVAAMIGAIDAAGLPVFSFKGSVTLTSSDSAATFPASVTLVNGRAFVPVTFRTAGTQTLTATDAADAARTATASTTVSAPAVVTKLLVFLPPQAKAGVATAVTVLAVDAAGRPVSSFNGSATVASSDSAASLPLVEVLFKSGRATFEATFATAGRQTLTVTSLGDSKVTGTAATTVAAPQTLASFLVMVPPRVLAGTAVNIAIIAMDANKRPIPSYAGSATLVSSDTAAIASNNCPFAKLGSQFKGKNNLTITQAKGTRGFREINYFTPYFLPGTSLSLPVSVTFKAGRAVARVTFATTGSQSLTVRGGVAGDVAGTATTAVAPAPVAAKLAVMLPRAVPAGTPILAMLVALDAQGKPVPNFTGTASLASSDAAARLPTSVTFVNGRAVARVVFSTLGEQTLTATSGVLIGSGATQVGQVTIQPVT